VGLLDREQVKELLYMEMELSRDIEQVIRRLRKAAHDLRDLGEALEKDPLLVPAGRPAGQRDNGVSLNLLVEFSKTYSFTMILAELVNLRRKREVLEEIQNRLAPVRRPQS